MRIVFCTLISRINRQFIQRKANCMNSTFCDSRWADSGANKEREQWIKELVWARVPDHRCEQLVQPSFLRFFESQVGQKYNYLEFHPAVVKDTKKNLPRLQTRHEVEGEKGQNSPDQYLWNMSVQENVRGTEKWLTNISGKKNLKERSNKIVDSLYISTCWMPYGPYVENTFQALHNAFLIWWAAGFKTHRYYPLSPCVHP